MKILLMIGNHTRHRYMANKVSQTFELCGIIIEAREEMIPKPPNKIDVLDKTNFVRHFSERNKTEDKYFNNTDITKLKCPILTTQSDSLNSNQTLHFLKNCRPDLVLVFGTGLLKGDLLKNFPKYVLNLHLGLSPWYKGSATLFWPFYNLEPQMAGITIHQITSNIDGGPIITQCVPQLEYGDRIHDVAAKAVLRGVDEILRVIEYFQTNKYVPLVPQKKKNGKLYLTRDFIPANLRIIYQTFNNDIVDKYLDGKLSNYKPQLITF